MVDRFVTKLVALVVFQLALFGATFATAVAQCPPSALPRLSPPDARPLDRFGSAVAAVGTTAIVGARGCEAERGAAYVFEWNGIAWIETRKLTASDGAAGDRFGHAVAMWEGLALVGAPGRDDRGPGSGAAYVFERTPSGDYVETAKLLAPNGSAGDRFGASVSMEDDAALIGAFRRAADTGAAYLFEYADGAFAFRRELTASDGQAGDGFGIAVGLEDETILIGAAGSDARGADSGAAYLFEKVGGVFVETAKLTPDDGAAGDRFGVSISVCPEYTVIGAPYADGAEADSGAAYLVLFAGLGEVIDAAKLLSPDGRTGDRFGEAVAVRGYRILVGAPAMDTGSGPTGAVYAYNPKGFLWDGVLLTARDGTAGDTFGSAVALGPDTAFVGAIRDDPAGPGSGSAYAYSGIEAYDVRAGNVNAGAGAVANVLFVNGTAGSDSRRTIDLGRSDPFELRIDAPPSIASGARFVVYAWLGEPTLLTCEALPRGTGHIGMPTPLTGDAPQPAFVANGLGHEDRLGVTSWRGLPIGRAPSVLARRPSGLGRAVTFYVQGLVRDPRASNGVVAVTNGILVEAR